MIQTIWKNRNKIISAFERNGSKNDYERLNEVMLMKRCLSRLNNR
jgi:hypothetical protein